MNQRAGGDHFGIQPGVTAHEAPKITGVGVTPFHHRSGAKTPGVKRGVGGVHAEFLSERRYFARAWQQSPGLCAFLLMKKTGLMVKPKNRS